MAALASDTAADSPTRRRSARRTVAVAATMSAATMVVLMLGVDRALLADGTGPTVEVFDDVFRVAFLVGLADGAMLLVFRPTRHAGLGIVLGVLLGSAALAGGFVVHAATSGSLG